MNNGFLDDLPDLGLDEYSRRRGILRRKSSQEREKGTAELRAQEQAKQERFRKNCEQGRRYFSKRKIRERWLDQLNIAVSLNAKPWDYISGKLEWERDRSVIYALMLFSMQQGSLFQIVPESIKNTKWAYDEDRIPFWIRDYDLSDELLSHIEVDLENEGLLSSTNAPDENSKKHANQIEGDESDDATEAESKDDLSWQTKAIALLLEHRDWSITKVAREVGRTRKTLYNDRQVSVAIKARSKQKKAQSTLPAGKKNAKTGELEAW